MAERIITSLAGLDLSSFCLFPVKMGHSVPHVSHRVFTNLLTEGISAPLTYGPVFCRDQPPSLLQVIGWWLRSSCLSLPLALLLHLSCPYLVFSNTVWPWRGSTEGVIDHIFSGWQSGVIWDDELRGLLTSVSAMWCRLLAAFPLASWKQTDRWSTYVCVVYILPET